MFDKPHTGSRIRIRPNCCLAELLVLNTRNWGRWYEQATAEALRRDFQSTPKWTMSGVQRAPLNTSSGWRALWLNIGTERKRHQR